MKWFPNRKGTAMGFVVGGFGGGAMVFNQIQTAIVNFENYKVRSTMTSVLTISEFDTKIIYLQQTKISELLSIRKM